MSDTWELRSGNVAIRMDGGVDGDAPPEGGQPLIDFRAPLGPLLRLTLINALLIVITLTVYRFWAKTKVRRHLWAHTQVGGTPLEYTGTGLELFVGFLIALVVVLIPFGVFSALPVLLGASEGAQRAWQLCIYLALIFLTGVAIHRARRYRLTRTRWRGIRGNLTGSSARYGWFYLWSLWPVGLTASWMTPWRNVRLWQKLVGETWIGDRPLRFFGSSAGLYGQFALLWITLAVLYGGFVGYIVFLVQRMASAGTDLSDAETIGRAVLAQSSPLLLGLIVVLIVYCWYKVKELRRLVDGIRFAGVRFSCAPSAWQLLRLAVPNTLLILLTVGLATPIAQWRYLHFVARHAQLHGTIDWAAIAQSSAAAPTSGEGLADAFDVGGAF